MKLVISSLTAVAFLFNGHAYGKPDSLELAKIREENNRRMQRVLLDMVNSVQAEEAELKTYEKDLKKLKDDYAKGKSQSTGENFRSQRQMVLQVIYIENEIKKIKSKIQVSSVDIAKEIERLERARKNLSATMAKDTYQGSEYNGTLIEANERMIDWLKLARLADLLLGDAQDLGLQTQLSIQKSNIGKYIEQRADQILQESCDRAPVCSKNGNIVDGDIRRIIDKVNESPPPREGSILPE